MTPESIHEQFDEDIEPAVSSVDDEPTLQAESDGAEPQDISEPRPEPVEQNDQADEPVQQDTAPPAEDKAPDQEKTVPYGALHAEREMRKELQQQLSESQQALGQLMSMKEQLDELRKGKQTDATEAERKALEEKFEEDPIGALREQQEQIQRKLESSERQTEAQRVQQERAAEQFNQFREAVSTKVAEFEQEHPDYSQAYQYLMEERLKEYRAMGITDPQQLQTSFDREALTLAQSALQRGKNPAEVAYEMAKVRGYTRQAAPDAQEGTNADGKGESLEQTMDRLEKGAMAAKTNQGGNSTNIDDTPSLSEISKMDDKAFDEFWDKMERQAYGAGWSG